MFRGDIGSIPQGNFGWAGLSGGREQGGTEISGLADAVAAYRQHRHSGDVRWSNQIDLKMMLGLHPETVGHAG